MSSQLSSSSIRERFAQNLRRLRLARGLTQEAVSAEAGISQTFFSQIETGSRNVSIDTIGEIARVLRVDVVEFFKP